MVGTVEVLGDGLPGGAGGLQPGVPNGVLGPRALDMERTRTAAEFVCAALPGLQALEVRKHMAEGPLAQTISRPTVVIGGLATGVAHGVGGRRTAEHTTAHDLDPAAVQGRFGLGVVAPVEQPVRPKLADAQRHVNEGIEIAAARLKQEDPCPTILAQPGSQHTTRRTATDHDVVELHKPSCPD